MRYWARAYNDNESISRAIRYLEAKMGLRAEEVGFTVKDTNKAIVKVALGVGK